MFNFLNLGFDGYRSIARKDLRNARVLSRALEGTYFTVRFMVAWAYNLIQGVIIPQVFSDIHKPISDQAVQAHPDDPESYQKGLPVVSFRYAAVGFSHP